jgi:short-subunit dehydrogenase
MLSPDKVAALIVKGMERGKPQIFTGSDSKLMNKLYRLNPVSATRFIARRMKSLLG